ncbi:radical SAM protein [Streptomyces mirabilis]|uniref:radical SAM protein n=1 Tax=Streptomyces mirabilis TaxID=68239 RepID=UPI0033A3D1BE
MTIPILSGGSPAAVDWTALYNFAALRGQFRVSLTPLCNEACWFCHNEGDVPPPFTRLNREARPRPGELTADDYLTVIRDVVGAGLKRVYFTGGEPLLSPLAEPVLTRLPDAGADGSYTLITNGSLIRKNASWLAGAPLDKVKVSLHYFSDASLFEIAGVKFGIRRILDGIDTAREIFDRVELNTLLQRENAHEILPILDYAIERRLPVQFIELVDTDFNEAHRDSAVPADGLIRHLRTLTGDERTEIAGVGQGRRVFRIDGVEIDIIQRDLGRHHVGQCGGCPLKPRCVEGFWSLRMDHAGGIQPCLLRDDLRLDIRPHLRHGNGVAPALARHLAAFTEGTL